MASLSRRSFLTAAGATIAAASTTVRAASTLLSPSLDPSNGLSYFDAPVAFAPPDIRIGYAAITWGGQDLAAIADIADAGYAGIQLRSNIVPEYEARPRALADELSRRRLTFVALSSGSLVIDPELEGKEIATHVRHAKFVRACGGLYLQCLDQRPKRSLTRADYQRLGRLLTEIGRRTADLGIPLGYHNHMNSIGERPEELDQVLDAADPRYVKLELDIAHYQQGGGDPVRAVRQHADRLLFLHIKDVESTAAGSGGVRWVAWVSVRRIGPRESRRQGRVRRITRREVQGLGGCGAHAVPDNARTPKESALINRKYLEDIGIQVGETKT